MIDIDIVVVCSVCGREHEPDLDAIRSARWRRCLDCREPPKPSPRRRPLDDPNPLRNQLPRATDEPSEGHEGMTTT